MNIRTPRASERLKKSHVVGALFLALVSSAMAQQVTQPKPAEATEAAAAAKADEETIVLNPFEVSAEKNEGYAASSTLAGTRLKTELKDVASAIQVVTPQFLKDTGATNVTELLVYTTNTEAAGVAGNFYGDTSSDVGYRNNFLTEPHKTTRVRGLGAADLTRDYFLTDIPMDSYNINSVDIQRGPNSILFGLGSPAGIINYSMKTPNMSKNKYSAEARYNSNGGLRGSMDVDQVILKNTLGIRASGLLTDNKYRQEYTYEKQERGSVSGRWTPKLADTVYTQFQANYEKGHIDANRPNNLPPEDWITPWFNPAYLNKWVHTNNLQNGGPNDAISGFLTGGPAGDWWDSLGTVFADPTSNATGNGMPDAIRQRGGNPWGGWVSPQPLAWAWGPNAPYRQKSYFANNQKITDIINEYEKTTGKTFNGMDGFGVAQMIDRGIFDYYNRTLAGPNNSQFNDFDALNLSFTQTYLSGDAGVEVVYDNQNYSSGYRNLVGGANKISIDNNASLRDGTPNPNLGRAFFGGYTDASIREREREAFRATAFYKFTFEQLLNRKNIWTDILGGHTVTGVYMNQRSDYLNRSYNLYAYDAAYTALDNDDRVFAVHYMGDSLLNSPDGRNAGINGLSTVQTPPTSLKAMVQGKGTIKDWSVVQVGTINADIVGLDPLYTGATQGYDVVENRSVIWQSRFFKDTVIGLVGWRSDIYNKYDKGKVPTTANGKSKPYDPSWTYSAAPVHAEAQTQSYGIMLHSPQFINKRLPWGTEFSLGYNQSSNFRPSELGTDIYGNQYPAPNGETKDWTLQVRTMNDKLNLRVTWFETSQNNSTFRGTAPGAWDIKGRLARAMNGMMTETWIEGKLNYRTDGTIAGRQNTTPEFIVNKWMFGTNYDQNIAKTPLPTGWTVANHPELLTQPLRVRASASTTNQGDLGSNGQPLTEPPITPEEADYRAAWFTARTDAEWARPMGMDLFKGLEFKRDMNRKWGFWTEDTPANLKQISDNVATGEEYEITYNPTNNWRLTFNASRQEAVSANVMTALGEYIEANRDFWHDGYVPNKTQAQNTYWGRTGYANIDYWGNNNGQTFAEWTTNMERPYLIGKASEGRSNPEIREWHWNAITSYDFKKGVLKGVTIGGAVRWQDQGVIGYYPMYNSTANIWVDNLSDPIKSDTEMNYDAWISYERKIGKKYTWGIAFNVRDLFASDDLIPIRANPDGSISQYRIPANTTWELTTRIEF